MLSNTYNMNLTDIQKKVVSRLLQDVMYADGNVTRSEITLLLQLHKKLGISENQMEEARHLGDSCYAVLNQMLPEEKELIAHLLHQMINADGEVHDEELKVYKKLSNAVGFLITNSGKAS